MKLPLVSVIVATYRREESLYNALISLGNQTYNNMEVIIVDDNADESWNAKVSDVVLKTRRLYNNLPIKLEVNKTNQGSARTRNIGIDIAQGEYITFLDDDDEYLPEKIENQLALMTQSNADYSITDLYLYNEKGKLIEKRIRNYTKNNTTEELLINHLKYHITGTDVMMFKKSYLCEIGYFDPIDSGDEFYLMLKAIENNGRFAYLAKCDVKAYVHTGVGGLSSGEQKIQGENNLFELKKVYFHKLDKKSIKYVKMRHYAVLAYAFLRKKAYYSFFCYSIRSFLCYPKESIILFFNLK